jgi:hypothetical protein
MREGRSPQQIGRKGLSNHRWIVGGKLCLLLNQYGLVVAWACDTANVADNTFQWLIRQFEEHMIVLSDTGFHAAEGDPSNLKLCQRGEWEDRMLVETVLSWLFRSRRSACVYAAFSSTPCESALSSRASESTKRQ